MSSTGGDEAALTTGDVLGATILNFGSGDSVDFEGVKYASGDAARTSSGVVTIVNSAHVAVASFDVSGTHTASNFALSADSSGDLLVSYASAGSAAPAAHADIFGTGAASPAELLGSYGSWFAEPAWAWTADLSAFDSWSALASSAGTDHGLLGSHHADHGSRVGANDAWGVAAGWTGSVGHGPGPGA
jgi:hypothetical protein